eukprot:jgi/Chlat1/7264/Chrsp58S06874
MVAAGEARRRFLGAFYWVNALVILSYWPLRLALTGSGAHGRHESMLGWEWKALSGVGVASATKVYRMSTLDGFLADALLYAKAGVLVMAWYLDKRALVWYLIVFGILFLLLKQPVYKGPGNISFLTPLVFSEEVLSPASPAAWLVEFYADWNGPCTHFQPVLAAMYSTETLKFGKLDVMHFPQLANEYDIDTAAPTKQLPTFILFEKGKEVARYPPLAIKNSMSRVTYSQHHCIRAFELDRRYACSLGMLGRKERTKES